MIQVVKVGQSERIFLSAGQMCCSLRFRVRRQSAEKKREKKNCQSGTVSGRASANPTVGNNLL